MSGNCLRSVWNLLKLHHHIGDVPSIMELHQQNFNSYEKCLDIYISSLKTNLVKMLLFVQHQSWGIINMLATPTTTILKKMGLWILKVFIIFGHREKV